MFLFFERKFTSKNEKVSLSFTNQKPKMMQKLKTTLVYILSVVGFLCCWLYGIGTIAAIIAVVVATKEVEKYRLNPELYLNGKAMKTAKTIAYVALLLSLLGLIPYVYYFVDPCGFWDMYLDFMNQNPNVTEEQLDVIYKLKEDADCR
jgi:polyferredoxin